MNTTIPAQGGPMTVNQIMSDIAFKPFYSPKNMLTLGIKGGTFGHDDIPRLLSVSDDLNKTFRGTNKWAGSIYDNSKNYFNVAHFQTERDMSGNGHAFKSKHPLGWFEWYCRFYYGEKSPADVFRLSQWLIGINTEWFYIKQDPTKLTDLSWQPARRQALLEWAVDPTLDPESYGCGDAF